MKKIRALVTKNNSPWSIIQKQVGANVYKHIVNFPDLSKKDEFISNQLFGGENYKDVIAAVDEKGSYELNNFLNIKKLKIYLDDVSKAYGSEEATFQKVANKDYCLVTYKDKNSKDVYLFYALSNGVKLTGGADVIEFDAELDIFFTFPLKFKPKPVPVLRAHLNRYVPTADGWKNNFVESSLLHKTEGDLNQLASTVPVLSEKLQQQYSLVDGDITPSGDQDRVNSVTDNMSWLYAFIKNEEADVGSVPTSNIKSRGSETPLAVLGYPYKLMCVPAINTVRIQGDVLGGEGSISPTSLFYQKIRENPKTLAIALLPYHPFIGTRNGEFKEAFDVVNGQLIIYSSSGKRRINFDGANVIQIESIPDDLIEFLDNEVLADINKPQQPEFTPDTPRNWKLEPKLFQYPLSSYYISTPLGSVKTFEPTLFFNESPKLTADLILSPEFTEYALDLTGGVYSKTIKETSIGYSNVSFPLELPVANDDYQAFLQNKKVSSNTAWASGGQSALTGAATGAFVGGGIGSVVPVVGTAIGAVAGAAIGAIGAGGVSLLGEYSKREDLKQKPIDVTPNTTTYSAIIPHLFLNANVVKETLLDADLKTGADYLYTRGYEVRELLYLNGLLDTRYYFNHIQANVDDVFSIIDTELSAPIKQIIAETVNAGLTLHHYRDEATWKGILAFDVENFEVEYEGGSVQLKTLQNIKDFYGEEAENNFNIVRPDGFSIDGSIRGDDNEALFSDVVGYTGNFIEYTQESTDVTRLVIKTPRTEQSTLAAVADNLPFSDFILNSGNRLSPSQIIVTVPDISNPYEVYIYFVEAGGYLGYDAGIAVRQFQEPQLVVIEFV